MPSMCVVGLASIHFVFRNELTEARAKVTDSSTLVSALKAEKAGVEVELDEVVNVTHCLPFAYSHFPSFSSIMAWDVSCSMFLFFV